jgi:hypothetical protein
MLQSIIKGFKAIMIASSLLIVASSISYPQERPHVTGVRVVAEPVEHKGECPATITFTGRIRMNGPGTVRYVWLRSDGGRVRPATLKFEEAGEQTITSTWRLGGGGLPDYRGWKSIRILYPNVMISNRAGFEIHCEPPPLQVATPVPGTGRAWRHASYQSSSSSGL